MMMPECWIIQLHLLAMRQKSSSTGWLPACRAPARSSSGATEDEPAPEEEELFARHVLWSPGGRGRDRGAWEVVFAVVGSLF